MRICFSLFCVFVLNFMISLSDFNIAHAKSNTRSAKVVKKGLDFLKKKCPTIPPKQRSKISKCDPNGAIGIGNEKVISGTDSLFDDDHMLTDFSLSEKNTTVVLRNGQNKVGEPVIRGKSSPVSK